MYAHVCLYELILTIGITDVSTTITNVTGIDSFGGISSLLIIFTFITAVHIYKTAFSQGELRYNAFCTSPGKYMAVMYIYVYTAHLKGRQKLGYFD